jgi:competence protein ComFC
VANAPHHRRVFRLPCVALAALVDAVLPVTCAGCGEEGELLCGRCRVPLVRRIDEPPGVPIGMVASIPDGLVQLEWCATYSGPVRSALHALKYEGERRLAKPIGLALAERWRRAGVGGDVLVPVPVHADRLRARGFNQAELLAGAAGLALGMPVSNCLARPHTTQAQHRLSRARRSENVGHAFALTAGGDRPVRGRWIVVVDDIVTTGATLSGCARILAAAGATAVSGLAVARDR